VSRDQKLYLPLEDRRAGSEAAAAEPQWLDGKPAYASGKIGQAARFEGNRFISAGDVGAFGFYDKFSLAAWVDPIGTQGGTILSRMTDAEHADGYSVVLENGRLQVNLVKRWLDDALRVETEQPLSQDTWQHVAVT